jgi:hypothetical protein
MLENRRIVPIEQADVRLVHRPWIEQFLKTQREPELAGVYIVQSIADIRPAKMPRFVIAYIEHRFG